MNNATLCTTETFIRAAVTKKMSNNYIIINNLTNQNQGFNYAIGYEMSSLYCLPSDVMPSQLFEAKLNLF